MNGSTLLSLLAAAAILLFAAIVLGGELPPFPCMRSGIVVISTAPSSAHKAC